MQFFNIWIDRLCNFNCLFPFQINEVFTIFWVIIQTTFVRRPWLFFISSCTIRGFIHDAFCQFLLVHGQGSYLYCVRLHRYQRPNINKMDQNNFPLDSGCVYLFLSVIPFGLQTSYAFAIPSIQLNTTRSRKSK